MFAELVPRDHAESSGGGPAPKAAHSDAAHVAAADAAVRKATARLWLTADCLACVFAIMAVALFIAAAGTNAITILIVLVVTAVPAAAHAGARWRGSNKALHATLRVHMMAPFIGALTMLVICVPNDEGG